jgi:hypothetical protein
MRIKHFELLEKRIMVFDHARRMPKAPHMKQIAAWDLGLYRKPHRAL